MTDFMTPQQRSRAMSTVRGNDTQIERLVRSRLHEKGFRFRKNVSNLPGRPDIVLPKYNVAIFINGCFWHGHKNCPRSKRPKTNPDFWHAKLDKNIARDRINVEKLKSLGWDVLVVWTCEVKNSAVLKQKLVIFLG